MEAIGKQRDQVAEHVARRRKAVEQQQCRPGAVAGLAVEDGVAVDIDGLEANGGHVDILVLERQPWAAMERATSAALMPSSASP